MNSTPSNNFIDSLEQLTCDDLAPKKKDRQTKGILSRILWLVVALALFAVATLSFIKVASNIIDFFNAQNLYDAIAGEFSPITGLSERPTKLNTGKDSYPLADFEQLQAGDVSYPEDEDPDLNLPVVNPGTEPLPTPTPSPDNSELPPESPSKEPDVPSEEKPVVKEDPLISPERHQIFKEKLLALQEEYKNSDIFAWIYIPGTNINYAVVQGKNNDYYLQRNINKKWNTAGSIYLDYRNDRNLLNNPFSVLYGHNIRTAGTMFNRLLELMDEEMFQKCRYVYVYTKEAALKYEIFSIYQGHANDSPTLSIPTVASAGFLTKIKEIQNKSMHPTPGITLSQTDHVLLLYTCSNSASDMERVYVAGVLVGIGM